MDGRKIPKAEKRIERPITVDSGYESTLSDSIDCPLCAGRGTLARIEFFEKTGMREPSLIADLSAKQAVKQMHEQLWGEFREQLTDQVAAKTQKLEDEIGALKSEKREIKQDIEQLRKTHDGELQSAKIEQKQL